MRQRTLILLVGGGVFLGVAVATLPASLITARLGPGLRFEGVSGSIWNGSADAVRIGNAALGAVSWTAEPTALLTGHFAFHVELARGSSFVRGHIVSTLAGGTVTADGVELDVPVNPLNPAVGGGWRGEVTGTVKHATLEKGWPVELEGAFTVAKLQPPGARVPIGSYAVEFDSQATTPTGLVGRVRDVDAPLVVRAQFILKRDRSFSLEGDVTPKPGAPPEVAQAVAFLGAPDAAGRREFVLGGTL